MVILGVQGDLDPVELTTLIEDQLRYRFGHACPAWPRWTSGAASIANCASNSIRRRSTPFRMLLNQVLEAVRSANLDLPAGKIRAGDP